MVENDKSKMKEYIDEITMVYSIYSESKSKLKIFGKEFVENNRNLCSIIFEGKEQKIKELIYLPFNKQERLLKKTINIKLKG